MFRNMPIYQPDFGEVQLEQQNITSINRYQTVANGLIDKYLAAFELATLELYNKMHHADVNFQKNIPNASVTRWSKQSTITSSHISSLLKDVSTNSTTAALTTPTLESPTHVPVYSEYRHTIVDAFQEYNTTLETIKSSLQESIFIAYQELQKTFSQNMQLAMRSITEEFARVYSFVDSIVQKDTRHDLLSII